MYDVTKIREDFPMFKNNPNIVYLDNAATSFKPKVVIDKVVEFYEKKTTNIHRGDYDLSYEVSQAFDGVRDTVRDFINAKSSNEIVFTSGDTQSLNTLAYGYGLKHLHKGDVILTTQVEHASNILPWFRVSEKTGCTYKYIPFNSDGSFNLSAYEKCFEDTNIKLVALAFVSNVLGYINPIKEITRIAHEHGAIVIVDGAQAVPHIKVDVQDLDIDFLTFSSHKMLGPDGTGILYGKFDLLNSIDPYSLGGGSNARFDQFGNIILREVPTRFESGTPNIEGVLGLNEAIKYLQKIGMDNISKYEQELSNYMMSELKKLDNVIIYNPNADFGIVTFNVKDVFAQDAATFLNKNGIYVRSGNHCAKILHNVISTNETVRASIYFYNTKDEIDKFISTVKNITLENCIGAVI